MDAVIYAAKSTEDTGGSIPDQLTQCRAMAEREGYTVAERGEYEDENKSAYHGNRGQGLEDAKARAAELAPCALIVQHTDRLARGDAVEAVHLVEIILWGLREGVKIRSVQDDDACKSLLQAVVTGDRNHQDSKRKGDATRDGLRRSVARGEWRGGTVPGGYEVQREVDGRGRKVCTVVKRDEEVYDLLWGLAIEGKSQLAISLELSRRGFKTRAGRKDRVPMAFTVRRVGQTLENPFYAGQQTWHDETFPGNWPTYVDVEEFYRLKSARTKHARR